MNHLYYSYNLDILREHISDGSVDSQKKGRPCFPKVLNAVLYALLLVPCLSLPALADATVTFIDVGRGEAIWLRDHTGHDALIDSGAEAPTIAGQSRVHPASDPAHATYLS